MIQALLGKKLGMTQIYHEDGRAAQVTVLRVGPCTVLQVKKPETDGYSALQLGFDDRKAKNVPRPLLGHVAKAAGVTKPAAEGGKPAKADFSKVVSKHFIREVGWDGKDEVTPGQDLKVDLLEGVAYVDVIGWSKGRGFAGVVKRHGFAGGPKTHGQSDRQRAPGAVGRAHSISKGVLPGKRMAGHMGNARITIKNLEVVKLDKDQNLLFVEGAVPGPTDAYVIIRRTSKQKRVRVVEGKKEKKGAKKK